MAFPPAINLVTITGQFFKLDGTPASGNIVFELTHSVRVVGDSTIIIPSRYVVNLDSTGSFSIDLPATDDPDLEPIPFSYKVTENLTCRTRDPFYISLPMADPTVDYGDLAPLAAPPPNPLIDYATQAELDAVEASLHAGVVHKAGAETITGVKTFDVLPQILDAPVAPDDATNKAYVDAAVVGGTAPDATTVSKGIIQLAGDLAGTAAAPTVPGLATKADDATVVHKAGTETITGDKNFTGAVSHNSNALVDTTDARLSDTRTPTAGSVVAASIATGAVTSTGILDGTILNIDVNASAAIAKSKLAPLDIVNADVNVAAAIAKSKLAALVNVQSYFAAGSFTWTKPTGVVVVYVYCASGGAGGGSGRRGAAGTVRQGGSGGGGGYVSEAIFLPGFLAATETVVVGAGGAGGAAVTTDNTDGNPGLPGGASYFKAAYVTGPSGLPTGGTGGTELGVPAGGVAGFGDHLSGTGSAGHAASTTGLTPGAPPAGTGAGGQGGGAGGGITAANVASAGSVGKAHAMPLVAGGGAAGSINNAGGTGTTRFGLPGDGGGGGGSSLAGAGGAGGLGSSPGGGGGGGGASTNGQNSGVGGAGSGGLVVVYSI